MSDENWVAAMDDRMTKAQRRHAATRAMHTAINARYDAKEEAERT